MRAALIACLLASACGEAADIRIGRDVRTAAVARCPAQESYRQLAEADLLMVIDASGSMGERVTALGLEVGRLVQDAFDSGLDYHIGFANTDHGVEQGFLRSCGENPLWITPEINIGTQTFMVACTLTILDMAGSDEGEVPIAAALSALGPELAAGAHAGFARSSARLTVVMMTDEADQSPGTVADWVQSFELLEPEAGLEVITVAGLEGDDCAAFNGPGWELTEQLDGQYLSICDPMASTVDTIVETAFALSDTFPLDGSPAPGTLVVEVCAGESIDCQRTDDWTLVGRAVVLDLPPRGGEWVRFSYDDC